MAYELLAPYTDEEYANFICEYNHRLGLQIAITDNVVYALEPNEIMVDGHPEIDPNYEEKQAQARREYLDQLSLTKREVFLAILNDKGITPEQIRNQITGESALIEFDYSERFYRGNPLITQVGLALGYTIDELDHLFEYGTFSVQTTTPDITESNESEAE